MLDNEISHTSDEYVYVPPVESVAEVPEQQNVESDLLEDYLDRVCAPLVGKVARSRRKEIRERVRERVLKFAAAHQELGSDEQTALELALAQCGDPAVLSQRWITGQTSSQTSVLNKRRFAKLHSALGNATGATAASLSTFGLAYGLYMHDSFWRMWEQAHTSHPISVYYRLSMFALPALAGLASGLLVNKKSARGTFNALILMLFPALIIPGFLFGLGYADIGMSQQAGQQTNANWLLNPFPALCGMLPWFVIGCLSSAAGGKIRNSAAIGFKRIARVIRSSRRQRKSQYHFSTVQRGV